MQSLTQYEARLAHALECQYGSHWYLKGAHPQTVDDYLRASDNPTRESAIRQMKRDAISYAAGVLNACLGEGLIQA